MDNLVTKDKGVIFIISSPSGGGKTTIARHIATNHDNAQLITSYTTRFPRAQEQDCEDYYFVSQQRFNTLKDEGFFLEYANVFDNYYGTPKKIVLDLINKKNSAIFDIDWQGMKKIKQQYPKITKSVFLVPPTIDILRQRLIQRAQDSEAEIAKRMSKALLEIKQKSNYDYIIVNDDLTKTIQLVTNIFKQNTG